MKCIILLFLAIFILISYKQVQEQGSPFGTFGIYYNGKFVTHELMTEKKFNTLIDDVIK